jgi:Ca2+-binding EF-hand superfamily protein
MTSEHIKKVIEFMDRESERNKTKEEIIKEFQEIGFFDSNGDYAAPYRNLGRWIDECRRKAREEQAQLTISFPDF